MHLADAFIQSDLQLHSGYTFSLVHVFPGNRTHNLLRNRRNALPLSHTVTHNYCKLLERRSIQISVPVWLSGRTLRQQRKRLWVRFPGNTYTNENV